MSALRSSSAETAATTSTVSTTTAALETPLPVPRRRSMRLRPSPSLSQMRFDNEGNLIGSGGSTIVYTSEEGSSSEISSIESEDDEPNQANGVSTSSGLKSGVLSAARRTKRPLTNGDHRMVNSQIESLTDERSQLRTFLRKWEVPRKVMHSSISLLVIYTWLYGIMPRLIIRGLLSFLVTVLSADYLRLHWPYFAEVYEALLGSFMRPKEKHAVTGFAYYLLGCSLSLALFPEDVAAVSVLILSLCDTSASTFGKALGRYTPNLPAFMSARKTVAGMTASILTGSLIALGFWGYLAPLRPHGVLSWQPPLPDLSSLAQVNAHKSLEQQASYFGWTTFQRVGQSHLTTSRLPIEVLAPSVGLIAGVAEAIDLNGLDDNLTLPLLSGAAIWVLLRATR